MRVFVYGTLKRGGRLHGVMERLEAQFVGEAKLYGYELHRLGWYPGVTLAKPGDFTPLYGELFDVKESAMEHLDRVEGAPHLFRREHDVLDDGTEITLYVYNQPLSEGAKRIESGKWDV